MTKFVMYFSLQIPEGLQVACFQGHPGLIYSLDWSQSDELLLSASADCTACVWSVKSQKYAPLQASHFANDQELPIIYENVDVK